MKKLLLILLCLPIIGFGQDLNSFSQRWDFPPKFVLKSQNPSNLIQSKKVNINGEEFTAYLCKSYKEWEKGQFLTLTEKFWYILPSSDQISKFQDTITKNGPFNQYVTYWTEIHNGNGRENFNFEKKHLLYLDGTIENGHYKYINGKISSIIINDEFWKPSSIKILNANSRYIRSSSFFKDIITGSKVPQFADFLKVMIKCDDNENCYKHLSVSLDAAYRYTTCIDDTCDFIGYHSRELNEKYFLQAIPIAIKQDFINLNDDFQISIKCKLGKRFFTRNNYLLNKEGFVEQNTNSDLTGQDFVSSGFISCILGLDIDIVNRFDDNSKLQKSAYLNLHKKNIDDLNISILPSNFRNYKLNDYVSLYRMRKSLILNNHEKTKFNPERNFKKYQRTADLMISKLGEKLVLSIDGSVIYINSFMPYLTNNILLTPNLSHLLRIPIGDIKGEKSENVFSFEPLPTSTVSSVVISQEYEISDYNQKSIINSNEWKGNGSGFIISQSGYIVTNHHVVEGMTQFEVEFMYQNQITSFNAKVIKSDATNDLAIIKIDDSNFKNLTNIPYSFKTRSSDVGTEVFALGYPMALTIMGKDIKFTDGKISSKTGFMGDITTYQTTTPIQSGNSGGPLFDFNGNLIGINSSGLDKGIADNVSYSIKSRYLLDLIDVLPESIELPRSRELANKTLTEQIKVLSDYVVLIKVK